MREANLQRLLSEVYDNDRERLKLDIMIGNKDAVSWNHLCRNLQTLPELEIAAHQVINLLLGYAPEKQFTIRHMPGIKTWLNHYCRGKTDFETFYFAVYKKVKEIRNSEFRVHSVPKYDPSIYDAYDNFVPQFKMPIRNRLVKYLGYTPDLETSIYSELSIRKILVDDRFFLPNHFCEFDVKALALINYRENVLYKGVTFANEFELLYYPQFKHNG